MNVSDVPAASSARTTGPSPEDLVPLYSASLSGSRDAPEEVRCVCEVEGWGWGVKCTCWYPCHGGQICTSHDGHVTSHDCHVHIT